MRPLPRFVASMLALALVAGGSLPAQAADPGSDAMAPTATGATGQDRTYRITLLTGDVAVLHVGVGGKQAAWVEKPADPDARPAQVFQADGEVHVLPAQAAPLVESGLLDDDLFNLSALAEQGLDDARSTTLPLLVQGATGTLLRSATAGRVLRSIDAQSVAASKDQAKAFWSTLTGARAATKVWLNAAVRATLDESVAQIGAPAAWKAGYDGRGVKVAVLDTGYDAGHPDLAGRVGTAKNFSDDPDTDGRTAVDRHGHGTHVAATIAGSGSASGGKRKGVAPGAGLLVGKILDDGGSGPMDQIIAGMEWAVAEGAKVINMSVGSNGASDGTDPMSAAVNRLTQESGALFVVAAGNNGPDQQTVTSPGAATEALTVGAVDKDDEPAWFSSRGPRRGDLAVKPEVVAPGVGIVAARAAGTTLGSALDPSYTSLNGTSMATPHVAGAAAILAQQHPTWTAAALKARLVSSSRPLGEPVAFQGAGRVDVRAAIAGSVTVDNAALSLGRIGSTTAPVTRTLTYHNPARYPVLLQLTPDVTSTGSDPRLRPALSLSRRFLIVPARGDASTEVRFDPQGTKAGSYAGSITARGAGSVVQTVVSATVDGPLRTVKVNLLDRNGVPARTGPVDLWNADTGAYVRRFVSAGTATFTVPDGRYTLVADIETYHGTQWPPLSETVAGDPDLIVTGDRTISYDARQARRLQVRTPQETQADGYDVMWHRSVGEHSFSTVIAQGVYGGEVYTLPSSRTRTGVFEFVTEWQHSQPVLKATVTGRPDVQAGQPQLASAPTAYAGNGTLPLVYAGTGRPEDYAGVDAAGKVVLVTRSDANRLPAQITAAKAAGAALLLAHDDQPLGSWRDVVWNGAVPAYRIDLAAGTRLRQALAADPGLRLDLAGVRDAGYLYSLAFTEHQIPAGQTYDAAKSGLATVHADYRENSGRMNRGEAWIPYAGTGSFGNSMSMHRNGPVKRTEYVNTRDVEWQRFASPSEFLGFYWTSTTIKPYRAGEQERQLWWGPLVHPGVAAVTGLEEAGSPAARFRDTIRVMMPHYLYGDTLRGGIQEQMGDSSELTLRRNGEVVGTASWPEAQFTVDPADASYQLDLSVTNGAGNWSDTSVHTESSWRFRSRRADRAVLPLIQLGYDLPTGSRNEVRTGTPSTLTLTPGYQPDARGPGRFTLTADLSYDDGTTWTPIPVSRSGRAAIPAATSPGFASIRVTATDAAGNQLVQRIDRAWRIQ